MAPRSIWNGTICFGLVRVPVKLYSSTESKTVRFREVHLKDGEPLEHRRICTAEDREVSYDEIVKGFEVGDGEYVVLEKEEIQAAAGDSSKVVKIDEFVDAGEIDPIYVQRTYYVGFRDEAESYALLQAALAKSKKAGVGRLTFHNHEYLVAIRAKGPAMIMSTLHFHDEVITPDELDLKKSSKSPGKKEAKMADRLIEGFSADFEPEEFTDEHRDAVLELIRAKAGGKKIKKQKRSKSAPDDDLAGALEASLKERESKNHA